MIDWLYGYTVAASFGAAFLFNAMHLLILMEIKSVFKTILNEIFYLSCVYSCYKAVITVLGVWLIFKNFVI